MSDRKTTDQSEPTAQDRMEAAGRELGKALTSISDGLARAGHLFTAQGSLGWLLSGNAVKARETLGKLPDTVLREVETNGRRLARMARDVREARPPQQ